MKIKRFIIVLLFCIFSIAAGCDDDINTDGGTGEIRLYENPPGLYIEPVD